MSRVALIGRNWRCWRTATLRKSSTTGQSQSSGFLGDGAVWVLKLARLNFPNAVCILDYYHACEHLNLLSVALYGEGSALAKRRYRQWRRALLKDKITQLKRVADPNAVWRAFHCRNNFASDDQALVIDLASLEPVVFPPNTPNTGIHNPQVHDLSQRGDSGTTAHTSPSLLQRITAKLRSSLREIKRQIVGQRNDPAWNFSRRSDHDVMAVQMRRKLMGDLQGMRERWRQTQELIAGWKAAAEHLKPPRRWKHHPCGRLT